MKKKKVIFLIISILLILFLSFVASLFFALKLKNPLLKTSDYFSDDSNLILYKQAFKDDWYFIRDGKEWFALNPKEKIVCLPISNPDFYVGCYFYNHDMSHGVSITDKEKIGEIWTLNWTNKNDFEFSKEGGKTYRIKKL